MEFLKKIFQSKYFWFIIRLWLGALFLYAGFSKLIEPATNFRSVIASYEVIPYFFIPAIAIILPWIEFLAGVYLILGYLHRESAAMIGLMSLSFAVLIVASKLINGELPASCGCFGEGIHLPPWLVIVMDIVNCGLGYFYFKFRGHFLKITD